MTRLGSRLQYFIGNIIYRYIEYTGKQNKSEGEILYMEYLHIQIPPTGYVDLILRSTAAVKLSTFEGTMRVL